MRARVSMCLCFFSGRLTCKRIESIFPGGIKCNGFLIGEWRRGLGKRLRGAFCSALREGALWIKFKDCTKYPWGWGDETGTVISDTYRVKRVTSRELLGQMKSQLGWQQEHHLADVLFFGKTQEALKLACRVKESIFDSL